MFNGWKNHIFYIVLLLMGVLYLQIKFVEIGNFYEVEANSKKKINLPFYNTSNQSSKLHYFEGVINSLIPQEVKLNIACDDEIREIRVNSQTITLPDKSRYTYNYRDWKYGYDFNIELLSSKNSIEIISFNKGGNYSLKIAYLAAIFGIVIAIFVYRYGEIESYSQWVIFLGIPLYIVVSLACFLIPLYSSHVGMNKIKLKLLKSISIKLHEEYLIANNGLNEDPETLTNEVDKIQQIRGLYDMTIRFPAWPFDVETKRKYLLSVMTPIVTILYPILVNYIKTLML